MRRHACVCHRPSMRGDKAGRRRVRSCRVARARSTSRRLGSPGLNKVKQDRADHAAPGREAEHLLLGGAHEWGVGLQGVWGRGRGSGRECRGQADVAGDSACSCRMYE
jgi:hypothetical protein